MNPDLAHSFVFSPPDDEPGSWLLAEPDDFADWLTDSFPQSGSMHVKPWDGRADRWTVAFEVLIGEVWLEGMVTSPWPGAGSFSVDNATPGEAAVLVQSFRERFVPLAASVVFTTGLGLENGVDAAKELPAGADVETIEQLLGEHAEAIEQSLGA